MINVAIKMQGVCFEGTMMNSYGTWTMGNLHMNVSNSTNGHTHYKYCT
jgi:hypothetical protein